MGCEVEGCNPANDVRISSVKLGMAMEQIVSRPDLSIPTAHEGAWRAAVLAVREVAVKLVQEAEKEHFK